MMNIAGTQPIEDPAYRYQMPRLATKIEGRGNGIKTVVVNMNELAQALHRDSAEITKFFGCELGAQTSWNAETLKSVVNGAHQAADMQTQLSRYIEGFVLCSLCRLPETQYKVKSDIVYQVCGACGAKEPVDMGHRLTTFITNAYKKAKKERASAEKKSKKDGKDKKDSKDKKSKKSSKTKKKKSSDDDEAKENGADLADHHAESKESVDDDEADGNESQEDYDDVETDDRSAIDGAVERFAAFLAENPGSSISEKCDELATLQTFSALRVADRVLIFIGAVFDTNAITGGAVHTHKDMLAALAQDEPRQLIAAMEWFCGVRHPDLQRWFPALLKHLYDEDLVEEDVIFAWDAEGIENMYSSPSIDVEKLVEVRAEAAPFLKWLREAEVDDDDDDDEEEEDDDA